MLRPLSPAVPVPPMVPAMPTVPAMPAHLGGRLRTFLDRGGGAGIAQRQRMGALGWSGQHEQCADGGKPENSRHVHLYLPSSHRISRQPPAVIWSPPRRDADGKLKCVT